MASLLFFRKVSLILVLLLSLAFSSFGGINYLDSSNNVVVFNESLDLIKIQKIELNHIMGDLEIRYGDHDYFQIILFLQTGEEINFSLKKFIEPFDLSLQIDSSVLSVAFLIRDASSAWWKNFSSLTSGNKAGTKLNWLVIAPDNMQWEVTHRSGDFVVPGFDRNAKITSSNGLISIPYSNDLLQLDLDHSRVTMGYLRHGIMDLSYSSIEIEFAPQVLIRSEYSNCYFNRLDSLTLFSTYDSLRILYSQFLEGESNHSTVNIRTSEELYLNLMSSELLIGELKSTLSLIGSEIKLRVDELNDQLKEFSIQGDGIDFKHSFKKNMVH